MKDTSLPAFPYVVDAPNHRQLNEGMSLRDYFAAQAMQGLLANPKLQEEILKNGGAFGGWIESSAYGFADAMLKERNKS